MDEITEKDINEYTLDKKEEIRERKITLDPALFLPKEIDISEAHYDLDILQNKLLEKYLRQDLKFRIAFHTNYTPFFFQFLLDKVRLKEPHHLATMGMIRGGKTLLKNSEIVIMENNELKIFPLYLVYERWKAKQPIKILCINRNTFSIEWKEIIGAFELEPEHEMLKITTNCGRKIKTTKDHSFILLKQGEFKAIKGSELKIGDLLPCAEKIPFPNLLNEIEGVKLNFNSGFFFGSWLSDGHIREVNGIEITKQDRIFLDKLSLAINNSFNIKAREYQNKNCKVISFFNKSVKDFIITHFGRSSKNKRVPDWIFGANEDFKKGFISGMLSGDFSINIAKDRSFEVSLTQKQKQIIDRISLLLKQFGILTTLRIKKNEQYGDYFMLDIISQDIPKIPEFFKIFHSIKKKELKKIILQLKKQDSIPSFIKIVPLEKEQINKFFRENGWNDRNSGDRIKRNYLRTYANKGYTSKEALQSQLNLSKKGDPYFSKLINSPLYFERITKIEEIENKEKVYDLSVKDDENFMLANGLFVHNSYSMITLICFINALYGRRTTINYICGNAHEFLEHVKMMPSSMTLNSAFLIDEDKQAVFGYGSVARQQKISDVQNIIAMNNVSTISINPMKFTNTDAFYGLRAFGRCTKTKTCRFMLYNLQESSSGHLPLGMVYIPIFPEVVPYWRELERDYLIKKKTWIQNEAMGLGDVLMKLQKREAERFYNDGVFREIKGKNNRLTYIRMRLGSEFTINQCEEILTIIGLMERYRVKLDEDDKDKPEEINENDPKIISVEETKVVNEADAEEK